MNLAKFLLVSFLVIAGVHASSAAVRIAGDRGGRMGDILTDMMPSALQARLLSLTGYACQLAPWF